MKLFPTFRYHPEHAPKGKLFQTPEELPEGWFDTPADFPKEKTVSKPKKEGVDSMGKDQLEEFARTLNPPVELDKRFSLKKLRDQVRKALGNAD